MVTNNLSYIFREPFTRRNSQQDVRRPSQRSLGQAGSRTWSLAESTVQEQQVGFVRFHESSLRRLGQPGPDGQVVGTEEKRLELETP